MILGFSYFSPHSGEMPEFTARHQIGILERSRLLLRNRSPQECQEIVDILNLILDQTTAEDIELVFANLEMLAEKFNEGETFDLGDEADFEDESKLLCRATERYVLSDLSSMPDLAWHELFAALAISLLNVAADDELNLTRNSPEIDASLELLILSRITHWIKDAERAVTYGKALNWGLQQATLRINSIEAAITTSVQDRARIAAKKRHIPTYNATLALARFFQEGDFPSQIEAVRAFCNKHPELVSHLAPTNRHRTLREGLSKQLNRRRTAA